MKGSIKEKRLLYNVRQKKDPEAYGALYDLYVNQIYRFVLYKLSNREEAEDVTSEVFLKAWQYLIDTDTEGTAHESFRPLIYTIARHKIIDTYRKRANNQYCAIERAEDLPADVDLERDITNHSEIIHLKKKMTGLKQEYQDVLHLRYIDDLPVREIASIMNKSNASVRVLLHRATKKLKDSLD